MKIIYFVENGKPTADDYALKGMLATEGNKVYFSNGSVPHGFQDSCDKVVMSKEFGHIKEWCLLSGIKFEIACDVTEVEEAKFVEVKYDTETIKEEKPKRGRKPAIATKVESIEDKED